MRLSASRLFQVCQFLAANNMKSDRAMDRITILQNPGQSYWEKLTYTQEGWISSVHDYKTFSNGFFDENFTLLIAEDSETKEFIGSVCVATYTKPEPLSTIGMYVVKKEFQGKGIGTRLFDEAVKLSAPRKLLYGVENMMPRYRDKYGFNKLPNWHLVSARCDLSKVHSLRLDYFPALNIRAPEDCGWDEIAKFYQKFLPQLNGSQLIKALLCQPQSYCRAAMTNDRQIVALIRVRETFNNELSIGPLLANDSLSASTVLRHALSRIENLNSYSALTLEFPNENTDIREFMRKMTNGTYTVDKVRTYPQFTHEMPVDNVYAVSQGDIAIL